MAYKLDLWGFRSESWDQLKREIASLNSTLALSNRRKPILDEPTRLIALSSGDREAVDAAKWLALSDQEREVANEVDRLARRANRIARGR